MFVSMYMQYFESRAERQSQFVHVSSIHGSQRRKIRGLLMAKGSMVQVTWDTLHVTYITHTDLIFF